MSTRSDSTSQAAIIAHAAPTGCANDIAHPEPTTYGLSCVRISPPLCSALCTLTYRLPAL